MTDVKMPDGSRLCDVVMKRFLVGAVARVLDPGCVHDWMPILIGGQNAGKSTFYQYLTPPSPESPGYYPWVSTVQQGINYIKDRPHVLHSGWIAVLDECDRYFKRQFVEEFKNIVSVGTDRSAKKYENERDFRRSFVLAGATNSDEFLVDPTGNRRFMPIVVDGKVPSKDDPNIKIIDLDRLKQDRDSIWAAAYKAYLDNPVHTFTSFELSHMSEYMENFQQESPLEYIVLNKFQEKISGEHRFPDKGNRKYWLMADIFEWLEIAPRDERSMTRQIADLLKRRGLLPTSRPQEQPDHEHVGHRRSSVRSERQRAVPKLELRDATHLRLLPFPVREWLFYLPITAAKWSRHCLSPVTAMSLTDSVLSDVCPLTSVD